MPTQPTPPAGRRRFWLTVLVFALFNLAAWAGYVAYDRAQQNRPKPLLRVEEVRPGEGQTVGAKPVFTWVFNLDAAPAVANAEPVGSVSPPVPGRWAWADGRTLTFTPDAELPRATRFTFSLPPERLRTAEGFRLAKTFTTTVQTTPLQVLAVRQAGFEDGRLVVEIEFNDKVLPADALKHVSLVGPDGEALACALHGEAVGRTVRLRTDPVAFARSNEASVKVRLSPGLAGRGGPLGIEAAYETTLAVASDLAATHAYASCPPHGDGSVSVHFNNEADTEALRQVMSVEPAVPFTLSHQYNGVRLTGAFQPATRYAVKIARPPAGPASAPNGANAANAANAPSPAAKRFPRPTVLSVFVPDRPPSVWFDHDEGYLGAAGNRTLMAHGVNVPGLKVTVTRVYDNNVVAWRNATGRAHWSNPDAYARPLATKRIELAREKNKPVDVPLSLDDLLPAGAARDGVYQVHLGADAAEDDRARVARGGDEEGEYDDSYSGGRSLASAMVTLSDVGLSAKRGKDGVTVWAVSLRTAKPLAGVRVRLYSDKGQPLASATTGDDGLAKLADFHPAPGEKPAVLLADRAPGGADLADGRRRAAGFGRDPRRRRG